MTLEGHAYHGTSYPPSFGKGFCPKRVPSGARQSLLKDIGGIIKTVRQEAAK